MASTLLIPLVLSIGGVLAYNKIQARQSVELENGMVCLPANGSRHQKLSSCISGQNEIYKVREAEDQYQAVHLLQEIHRNLKRLVEDAETIQQVLLSHQMKRDKLQSFLVSNDILSPDRRGTSFNMKSFYRDLTSMIDRFTKLKVQESTPSLQMGVTSYTDGKEIMSLCLRDPQSNQLHDLNTLMYTAIHELAHLGYTIGHTADFKLFFQFLRRRAIRLRLYQDIDFVEHPKSFCGTTIANNVALW